MRHHSHLGNLQSHFQVMCSRSQSGIISRSRFLYTNQKLAARTRFRLRIQRAENPTSKTKHPHFSFNLIATVCTYGGRIFQMHTGQRRMRCFTRRPHANHSIALDFSTARGLARSGCFHYILLSKETVSWRLTSSASGGQFPTWSSASCRKAGVCLVQMLDS